MMRRMSRRRTNNRSGVQGIRHNLMSICHVGDVIAQGINIVMAAMVSAYSATPSRLSTSGNKTSSVVSPRIFSTKKLNAE